jgi:hypothetical protein
MLKEWLSKADTLKPLYTLAVDKDAGTDKTILDHLDMDALVKRVDFPSNSDRQHAQPKRRLTNGPITLTRRARGFLLATPMVTSA